MSVHRYSANCVCQKSFLIISIDIQAIILISVEWTNSKQELEEKCEYRKLRIPSQTLVHKKECICPDKEKECKPTQSVEEAINDLRSSNKPQNVFTVGKSLSEGVRN